MTVSQPEVQPKSSGLNKVLAFIKKYWSDYLLLFLVAAVIVTSDQLAKVWVRAHVPLGGDWLPPQLAWLMPYARIRFWYNSGAAFGLFANGNLIFMVLAILVACAILYYFPRTSPKEWWLRLALMLQFSGAVGNLTDRIQFGHVTDFISVGNFAIFNIADSSITVGVAILILGVWISELTAKRKAAALKSAPSSPTEDEAKGE